MLAAIYGIGTCAIVIMINYKYDFNLLIQLSVLSVINSLLFFLYFYIDSGIQDLEDGFMLLIISIMVSMMVLPIFAFEAFKGRELREKLESRKK